MALLLRGVAVVRAAVLPLRTATPPPTPLPRLVPRPPAPPMAGLRLSHPPWIVSEEASGVRRGPRCRPSSPRPCRCRRSPRPRRCRRSPGSPRPRCRSGSRPSELASGPPPLPPRRTRQCRRAAHGGVPRDHAVRGTSRHRREKARHVPIPPRAARPPATPGPPADPIT